jgi:Flp pilus assembly pilin Flp
VRRLHESDLRRAHGWEVKVQCSRHESQERGAVFTEYALLITFIAGVVVLSMSPIGAAVQALFVQAWNAFP